MEETPSPLPPRGVIGSLAALFGRGRSRSVCVQKPTASRPSNFARTSSYEGNAFDSPLQEAIGLLEEVQQRLAKKSPVEAELIGCALGCLHERDLLGAKTIQQMNDAAGGPRVDAQLEDWLDAMQWLQKADGDEADEAPFGLSKRDATTGCGDSSAALTTTETAALNEEGSAAALAMPQCINPKVSTLLLSGAEARVAQLLEHELCTWEFDALELDELTGGHALQAIGWAICSRSGLTSALSVSAETLQRFLARAEEGYRPLAYHNAAHAACVTHGVYFLLTQTAELRGLVANPVELFSAIFAALTHDLGHTGHNNAFHVATGSELAVLYSDQSVLEMHHLASAFKLLQEPEAALLANLSSEARREVRARAIGMGTPAPTPPRPGSKPARLPPLVFDRRLCGVAHMRPMRLVSLLTARLAPNSARDRPSIQLPHHQRLQANVGRQAGRRDGATLEVQRRRARLALHPSVGHHDRRPSVVHPTWVCACGVRSGGELLGSGEAAGAQDGHQGVRHRQRDKGAGLLPWMDEARDRRVLPPGRPRSETRAAGDAFHGSHDSQYPQAADWLLQLRRQAHV